MRYFFFLLRLLSAIGHASMVHAMFDGETPVRTKDVATTLGRNYGTVKTHLHRAGQLWLLVNIPRRGWLVPATAE